MHEEEPMVLTVSAQLPRGTMGLCHLTLAAPFAAISRVSPATLTAHVATLAPSVHVATVTSPTRHLRCRVVCLQWAGHSAAMLCRAHLRGEWSELCHVRTQRDALCL